MWKKLPYSKPLFISFTTENGYLIYVTDYINIWWSYYSENDFLSLLEKSNDDLEMESNNQLLQLGLKMLSQPENIKNINVFESSEKKTIVISMTSTSYGFPFFLELKLTEGSREMFFNNITQCLLKTVQDLKTSENELRFLLMKKDKEIEEYKTETDVRLAMYLKTGVYRDEEHMGKHVMYEKNFGTLEVSKCLLENIKNEAEDKVVIKEENLQIEEPRIKVEPESQPVVKQEPNISESEVIHNVPNSGLVKQEVKNESQSINSAKKRPRKMLKI